eukprot:COSAG05_NODE_234_length_13214_cov_161.696454_4_plen_1366_part_00
MLAEQEARLREETTTHEIRLNEFETDVQGLHDKVEASAEHILKRLEDAGKDINTEVDRVEALVRELSRTTEGSIAAVCSRLDTNNRQHDEKLEVGCEKLNVAFARGQDLLVQRLDDIERTCASNLDTYTLDLDSKIAGLKQTLSKTTERVRTQVNGATESLASKCHSTVAAVEAKISRATARLDLDIASLKEELTTSVRVVQKNLDSQDAVIRTYISTEMQTVQENCWTGTARLCTRMEDELKTVNIKIHTTTGKIETAMHRLDDKFDSATESLQTKSNQQMIVLDGLLKTSNQQAQSDLQDLRSIVEAHEQELQQFTKKVEVDHDVRRKAIAGLDAKLAATASKLNSEIHRCFQHFKHMCTQIDARVTGNYSSQTAQLQTQQAHFTDEISSLGRCICALQSKVTSTVDKFSATAKTNQSKFNACSEELRHAIEALDIEQAARISKIEGKHADRYRAFQRKTTERFSLLDANVNMQRQLIMDSCTQVGANLTKAVAELRNLVDKNQVVAKMSSSRLEFDLKSKCDEVRDSMLRIKQVQSSAVRKLDEQVSKHLVKVEDVNATVLTLRQDVSATSEQHTDSQKQFAAAIQQLDRKCLAQGQDLAADILGTRQMISNNTANLISEMTSLRSEHASRLDELGQTIEGNSRHCVDMYSKLDQNSVEHHQHFTNVCAAMDAKHGEKIAAMDTREQNRYQKLTEMHDNTVRLFDGKHLEWGVETQAQTKRFMELRCLVEKYQQDLRDMSEGIEKKLVAKDSAQDRRLDDMREAIEANHMHFTEVAKTMHSQFSDEISGQSRRLGDEIISISKRCSDEASAQQLDIVQHHQAFVATFDVLRRDIDVSSDDLQGKCAELGQKLANTTREVKSMCVSLDSNLRQQLSIHKVDNQKMFDDILRGHDFHVSSTTNFQTSTAKQFQVGETQLRDVHIKLQAVNLSLATAMDKMDAQIVFHKQSHERNLSLHTHHIEDTCNSLDLKFSDQVAEFQGQLEEQMLLCEDFCSKVERKCAEVNVAQVLRADKTDELIQSLDTRQSRSISEMEERVKSADSAQKMATDRLKHHLDVGWGTMDAKWMETMSEFDARLDLVMDSVRGNHQQLNNACSDLTARIAVEIAAQDERVESEMERLKQGCRQIQHAAEKEQVEQRAQLTDFGNENYKNHNSLANDLASMKLLLMEKNSSQDACVEDIKIHFAASLAELDKRFLDAEQDARLDRLDATIRQHFEQFMGQYRQVQDQISSAGAESHELSRNHYNQFLDVARDLEQKIRVGGREQEARIDRIITTVDDHHRASAAVVVQLDTKVSNECEAQDERIAALHEHFTAVCDDLAKRFRFGEIETRMDQISSTISENHQHFTTGTNDASSILPVYCL